MADPVTLADITALARDHNDIRFNTQQQTSEIIKEGLKESFNTRGDVKDTKFDVATRMSTATAELSRQVDAIDDTLSAQLITLTRDSADNRAQIQAVGYQVRDGFVTAAKDAEINALKTQMEGSKNTLFLSDKIGNDGEKTRALINEHKNADLNRMLIERTTELHEHRFLGHHWRGMYDQGQYMGLSNQIQALGSQFTSAAQGLVNFGTFSGAQTSSANSVR